MQLISKNKTVRSITVQDLKEFNSQSLSKQVEKKGTTSFNDACFQKKI